LLSLFPFLANSQSGGTISVSGPPTPQPAGTTFTVPVQVSGVTNVYAAQFDLQFDPAVLTAVLVSEGTFLRSGATTVFVPGIIDNAVGRISFVADTRIGPVSGASGSGTLATITFVSKAATGTPLTLSNVILLNSALGDISVTIQSGAVGSTPVIPTLSTFGLLLTVTLLGAIAVRLLHRET
jgi:hypothetical protein